MQISVPCRGRTRPEKIRKLERAVAVRKSLLEKSSGKFRRCWKILPRFSGSTKCYPCQGSGIFRQGKWLLENRPRLRERSWIFSSETATAFLSFSETRGFLEGGFCKNARLSWLWRSEWAQCFRVLFLCLGATLDSVEIPFAKTPFLWFLTESAGVLKKCPESVLGGSKKGVS